MTNLNELRIKLDQQTEKIVSGLKDRSRYKLNADVFMQQFYNGMTWFEYRLFREQDLDSEFGRFEFPGQSPILFPKKQLSVPKKEREAGQNNIPIGNIQDSGEKIINIYRRTLPDLCQHGECPETYGETAKCDASNVLLCNERIIGLGRQVAEAKIQESPGLVNLAPENMRGVIINPKREEEVILKALDISERYELQKPELIRVFFRGIIDMTVDAQIRYIRSRR